MNEWWLLSIFIVLLMIALGMAYYPLRAQKRWALSALPVLMVIVVASYWQWGALVDWRTSLQDAQKMQQVQAMLKTIKTPSALIEKLKTHLNDKPDNAEGWYLLGRLYSTQNEWDNASDAFKTAYALEPDNSKVIVNYAQSLWELNQQQFNPSIRGLFNHVLQNEPEQPDALAMLAMDAFMNHDYSKAIHFWQRLLKLLAPDSNDAKAIRKAIANAQSQKH